MASGTRLGIAATAAVMACLLRPDSARADDDGRPAHPHPRVIVTVDRVRGPHERDAVERAARQAWGRIVACYREAMGRGVLARGVVEARLEVSGEGAVKSARRRRATVEDELAGCVVGAMRGVSMPEARGGSTVELTIRVAPGD